MEFRYVAVNIENIFKLGSGPMAPTATADVVADLAVIDPEDLLSKIQGELDLSQTTSRLSPPLRDPRRYAKRQ